MSGLAFISVLVYYLFVLVGRVLSRVRLWLFEGDLFSVLALPEAIVSRGGRLFGVHGVMASIDVDSVVLGFYSRPPDVMVSGVSYGRRISGGPVFTGNRGSIYAGLVYEYVWGLRSLLRDASKVASCITGALVEGGVSWSRDGKVVVGVSKIGGRALVELLVDGFDVGNVKGCIGKVYGRVSDEGWLDEALIPDVAVGRVKSEEWLRLTPRPYNVEAESSREGFHVRFTGWVEEGLLHWVDVDGNFYASPPSQVLALIDNVQQVIPSEGLAYEFVAAWGTFIDTAGVTIDNIREAFYELIRKAGMENGDPLGRLR